MLEKEKKTDGHNLIFFKFLFEEYSFDRFKMAKWIWPKNLYMTENITPANFNHWNMTKNVRQRLTIMGEYGRIKI